MRLRLVISCLVVFFLSSCDNALSCLEKSTGIEKEVLNLPSFTKLEIKGNVDIELSNGDVQTVIEADGSVVDLIDYSVDNETLKVSFEPACKTFKSRKIKLIISTRQLDYMLFDGQGEVYSSNILKYPKLTLDPKSGVMDVNLKVEMSYLGIETGGISSFKLSGKSNDLWIGNYGGDGLVDARGLVVNNAVILHKGTNVLKLNVVNSIDAKLQSTGDVLLFQTPTTVKEEFTNTGRIRYN